MEKTKIIIIGGPTATGKTSLAVSIAKKYGGEIISSDSMQIYRGLNIGSAKPTEEEKGGIPHHMLDIAEPYEAFSVADFTEKAREITESINKRGKLPIMAGGTGLYISSFADNVDFSDASPDMSLRQELNDMAEKVGAQKMHDMLAEIDPEAAKMIHPNNVKRVIRAIEIYKSTGKTMTEQNALSKQRPSPYEPLMIALTAPREILYERINKRVDKMVSEGLFEETEALLKSGLTAENQSMQGIGYKELIPYFEGKITKEQAICDVKRASRRYAKRQLTWFRRDKRYHWFDITEDFSVSDLIRNFI